MGIDSSIGFLIPRSSGFDLSAVYTAIDAMAELSPSGDLVLDAVEIVRERRLLIFGREVKRKIRKRIARSDYGFNALALEQLRNDGYISLWNLPSTTYSILLDGHSEIENSRLWAPESVSIQAPPGTCDVDLGEECVSFDACKVYFWGYGYFYPHSLDATISIIAASESFRRLHDSLISVLPESIPKIVPCEGESGKVTYLDNFLLPVFASQSF